MKETEFDRFERADKLNKEASAQQRKNMNSVDFPKKKKGKPKPGEGYSKNQWVKDYEYSDDEYDFAT